MRRFVAAVSVAALLVMGAPAAAPADEPPECGNLLVWDYRQDRAVVAYEVVRGCDKPARGKIHIQGWFERCDLDGSNCTIVEKEKTCRGAGCRLKWVIPHPESEVARYRAEIEDRATRPRSNGSASIDWICYTTTVDRDCIG